jgi:hypothetical protein
MNLERLCELLGLDVNAHYIPPIEGDTGKYSPYVTMNVPELHETELSALNAAYSRIEQLVFDIIWVNRGLSNEDLARILLNKEKK